MTITSSRHYSGISFVGADLTAMFPRSDAPGSTSHPSASIDMSGHVFEQCQFDGQALQHADLRNAIFDGCSFTSADLSNLHGDGVRLVECNLTGAVFDNAWIAGARLTRSILVGASFHGANVSCATFDNANLTSADFRDANANCARFQNANCALAVFAESRLIDASFYGADLTGADLTGADVIDAVFTIADTTGMHVGGVAIYSAIGIDGYVCEGTYSTSGERADCPSCGGRFYLDDGRWQESADEYYCEECWHEEPEDLLHEYEYRPVFRYVRHDNDVHGDTFLGVEVELHASDTRAVVKATEWENDVLYCKRDSSIGDYGVEVVSHPMTLESWREALGVNGYLADAWNTVRAAGATAWTRSNYGTHVHVSRDAFYARSQLAAVIELLRGNRSQWRAIAGRETSYADLSFGGSNGIDIVSGDGTADRYHAVNLTNVETVELRIFQTSTRPDRILGAVEIGHSFVTWTRETSAIELLTLPAGDMFDHYRTHVASNYPSANEMIIARLGESE